MMVWLFCRYEGYYVRGLKEGEGKFLYPDGSTYVGQWKSGKRFGCGKYTYANGDWYDGNWKDDVKDGHGVYHDKATDSIYSGDCSIFYLLCFVFLHFTFKFFLKSIFQKFFYEEGI